MAQPKGKRKAPALIPRRSLAPREGASERQRMMVDRYNTAAVECAASLVRFPHVPATDTRIHKRLQASNSQRREVAIEDAP